MMPEEVKKAVEAIEKIYEESIESISVHRDRLVYWKENYGVSVEEAEFLDLFREKKREAVTGEVVSKIKKGLDMQDKFEWLSEEWVKKYWERNMKKFEDAFHFLNEIGKSNSRKTRFFDSVITSEYEMIAQFFPETVVSYDLLYRAS